MRELLSLELSITKRPRVHFRAYLQSTLLTMLETSGQI